MENAQKSQGIKSKEISYFVETNHLGQIKISSTEKTRKWIWVNANKYEGILRHKLACLKWGKMRRKPIQRNKINKRNKNKEESIIYSPISTPLTWSSDLYVQELMKARTRVEILEARE